ncbi:MAG: hypothetical protein PHX83_09885 [Acidobacteriia bacterium]|nr:hypothetical protein [Terriglobia bacterium]
MKNLEDSVANYIFVLAECREKTHRAEDRDRYTRHLAQAAVMFSILRKGAALEEFNRIVAEEQRSYGWDYLSDEPGRAAEEAFARFVKAVGA